MFEVGRAYNRVMGIHEPHRGRGEGASQHLGTCPSYSCAPGRAASSTIIGMGGTARVCSLRAGTWASHGLFAHTSCSKLSIPLRPISRTPVLLAKSIAPFVK